MYTTRPREGYQREASLVLLVRTGRKCGCNFEVSKMNCIAIRELSDLEMADDELFESKTELDALRSPFRRQGRRRLELRLLA